MLVSYMNLKKLERYLRVNLMGPGPRFVKKNIYRAAVSQRLRNTDLDLCEKASKGESCGEGQRTVNI